MQTNYYEAPQSARALNQSAEVQESGFLQTHIAETAHNTGDQFLYQGAVVVAIVLFLVSIWSL